MSNQHVNEQPQRVATPAYLHQRLLAFRMGTADAQTFVLRDNVKGQSYDFEPWQFFLLEVLPGCTDDAQLMSVFEDRFGRRLSPLELDHFLASLADAKLYNEAATTHPLLTRFSKKTYVVQGERAVQKPYSAIVAEQHSNRTGQTLVPDPNLLAPDANAAPAAVRPAKKASKMPDADETLAAGMQDATDFDPRSSRWMLVLFNPTLLLKIGAPILAPLRHLIFALPLALVGALVLVSRYAFVIEEDLRVLLAGFGLYKHWLFSLLTVNFLVTVTTAIAAHRYRASVKGFGIALIMRFYPRFALRIGHQDQLSRVERMWLHGAPLLMRLTLFSAGVFIWYGTRGMSAVLPTWGLALATTSAISLLISGNPLIKSSGYHLMAAFTNEPHLRGKALRALLNKVRGKGFKEANDLLLATYAITMGAFMFVLVAGAAAFTGFALHQLHLGGSAIIIASIVGFALLRRVVMYFSKVEQAYDRSLQFDRWRKRTHGKDEAEKGAQASRGFAHYIWKAGLLAVAVAMFLPYDYRAGGEFVVHPQLQQVITTDVDGRIEEVNFDGGENIPAGTVIAKLAMDEDQAQADILEMKMAEQQAVIDDFGSYPRPEDIRVAKRAVQVEETRVKFSRMELRRIEKLAKDDIVPREELDDAQKQLQVDLTQRAEKRAELGVARLGKTEFELVEAEAELATLKVQRDALLERIERSKLVMPFDGRLLTLHLKEKGNSYYKAGDVFADVEATGQMTAELKIPESEADRVEVGSIVQFKPIAYSSEVFTGTVTHIDWDVTEEQFGNVIKVIAVLDDEEGRLRNGMTGYAKVDGPVLLVWEAFSQQIVRFFEVEVWSWVP